ncbi:DUF5011 domain-containing protein, partial [Akkermansiaceae bacterium]|nr:DUF5011 domain-containing protein [Akkermansiaceae bacterium]
MKLILGLLPVLKRSGAFLALFAGSFLPLHADNTAPVAVAQSVITDEDTALAITLAGTDADPYSNPVLDQSQASNGDASDNQNTAQSFTAGQSGELEKVELYLSGNEISSATVTIREGSGTSGNILDTQTVTGITDANWYTVNTEGVTVTAGNEYTIHVTHSGFWDFSSISWYRDSDNPYAGGRSYYSNVPYSEYDLSFKTYVKGPTLLQYTIVDSPVNGTLNGLITVLDQSQASNGDASDNQNTAQSFTAGQSGELEKVELYLSGNEISSATVTIREGSGTSGNILDTQTVTGINDANWYTVNTEGVTVTAGNEYTIHVTHSGDWDFTSISWYRDSGNPYAGGRSYYSNVPYSEYDLSFKTYVKEPLVYVPNADYNGTDSFTFKVNDGLVDSTTATVSITVNAINDAPVAPTSEQPSGSGTDSDPYLIANLNNLYWLSQTSAEWVSGKVYRQTADIDASTTSLLDGGAGFAPLRPFHANYDGGGYVISGLFINRPTEPYAAFIGAGTGQISNLGLENVDITGKQSTAGFIAFGGNGLTIDKCYVTGTVKGNGDGVGGFMNRSSGTVTISNSYSTASVTGTNGAVGGFLGYGDNGSATISNCYSTGVVTGGWMYGGFAGFSGPTYSNTFWDKEKSGQTNAQYEGALPGVSGLTTSQMQTASTFTDAGWSTNIWILEDGSYPALRAPDTTAPDAPTLTGPILTNSATPTLTGTAEAGSTVKVYEGDTELGQVTANASDGSYSITVSTLTEGSHSITATGTDTASNESGPSVAHTVVVDTTAPIITSAATGTDLAENSGVGQTVYTITATDTVGVTSYAIGGADVGLLTLAGSVVTLNADPDYETKPSYSFTVTASDAAGNTSDPTTVTFSITDVDEIPPVISVTSGNDTVDLESSWTDAGATADTGETVVATGTVNTSEVGTYTITYAVTDAAGNVATPVTRTVTVEDTTKPVITLTGGDVTLEVGGSYDDPGATFSDNYDTELTVTINSSAVDATVLGSYNVIYSATDGSGNVADQVTRKVTVVDTTPPVITLNGDAEVTIEMGGTYTEQGATVSDNYYTTGLDVDVTVTPTGAVNTSAEGTYEITYSVTDGSNNTGTATRTVIVDDTMPPTSPGLSGPSLTNSPTPTLNGVAEFGSTVRIYHGANLLGSVGLDVNESYSFQVPSLEDGSYGITATATDKAGNVSAASPAITVVVDTEAPAAPTLTGSSLTNSPTPTLTGTAEAGSTVLFYDGGIYLGMKEADSGSFSFTVPNLSDGSHDITATATDEAGNVSASTIFTVMVDTTAPAAPTLTGPSLTNSPSTLTLTGTAEAGSTVYFYDGGNFSDGGFFLGMKEADSGSFSFKVPVLSDGSHDITAVAYDPAINMSADTTLTVVVDTTAPVITLLGSVSPTTAEAGFQYSDAGATADGQESVVTAGAVDTSILGDHLLNYTAQDLAGNVGTATRTVTVEDTTQPAIALNGFDEVTLMVGQSYDEPGATVSDNYDTGLSAEIDASNVDTSVVGTYTVTYNVTDSNSNVAQQVTRTVKVVDTTSPVITLTGDALVTIPLGGTYQELGATVSDNYDTELAVTIDSSTIDTSVVAPYTVTYKVTDDSGNMGTAERTVNVVDITPPVITLNGGDVTIEAGGSYDDQGATVSDNYYTGLSATPTGTVSTSAVGTYTITYSATDGSQNEGTATRTVTVEDTTAPVVTVLPGIDAVVMGASWTDAGAYADGMEDVITEGSVNTSAVGTYTITYSATDGSQNTGTATRTVIVRNSVDSFGDVVVYPNQSTTLIGQVTIEGEAAEIGDVVGVYVEDELTGKQELRGKQEVIIYEGNAWVNMLVNSAGDSETIIFKVFDSSTGLTHEKTKSSAVIGQDPFTLGDAENPFMIEMKDFETQTLSLKEGWNLVSFYVEADDMSPQAVLAPILNELVQIRSVGASYNPNVESHFNISLPELSVKDGYWLEVSEDVSFEVEGRVSSGVSIDLQGGWNLVGYPRMNGGEAVDSELASLGSTVLQMKSLERSYDPNNPSFLNTLSTIVPGSGYWLNVSGPGTWELGDGGPSFANFKTRSNHSSEQKVGPVWSEPVVYPNLGATVLAEVSIQGKPVAMGSVVGVFVGDELRGRQNVVLHEGNSYVTLNVNLNGEEEVSYRVWNSGDKCEYLVSDTMLLDLGGMYGNPDLVELNGVEVVNKPLQVFNITSEPFGFSFNTMAGRDYTVEATGDLRTWEAVESFQGSGGEIRFTPRPASSG